MERQAAALLTRWGPPSVTPDPPLRLVLFAPPVANCGPSPQFRGGTLPPSDECITGDSGASLSAGTGLVLPSVGGLSMWRDDGDARLDRTTTSLLRVLMGFPPSVPTSSAAHTAAVVDNEDDAAFTSTAISTTHSATCLVWTEVAAVLIGCAHTLLRDADTDLASVARLAPRLGRAAACADCGFDEMVQVPTPLQCFVHAPTSTSTTTTCSTSPHGIPHTSRHLPRTAASPLAPFIYRPLPAVSRLFLRTLG